MKHFSVTTIFTALLILLLSCQQESGSGTLKITIQTESKSISAPEDAGRIIKYTITGTGPGNKTFSENSNSRTVTIEGIPNGSWEIDVSGLAENGRIIATGHKSIKFSGSNASEIIRITKSEGEGSLSVKVNWDSDVIKPQLIFYIDNLNTGTSSQSSVNAPDGSNEYTQTFDNIQSGYYLIRTELYEDGIKKAGCCEAFNIEKDCSTSGKINLSANAKDGTEDAKISLLKTGSQYINAVLGNIDSTLINGKNYSAKLSLTGSMNTEDRIFLSWYSDGVQVQSNKILTSTVSSFSFVPSKGRHIINAVLYDSTAGTCASARIRYTAYNDEPCGTATFAANYDSERQQKIKLDSSTKIGALPAGKFLILTPLQNTLQLVHVSDSALVLENNGTYTNTMENFSCISDATMLYSGYDSHYFIIVDNKKNVHLMHFNEKSNTIERAIAVEDDSVVSFIGNFLPYTSDFTDIDRASIVANSDGTSTLLFTDSYSYEIFSDVCTEKGVKTKDICFKPGNIKTCNAFAAFSSSIVYSANGNLYQAGFDGRTATTGWSSSSITNAVNPFKILNINNSNILMACEDRIKRIQFTTTPGIYKILDDVNISVKDICLTPDHNYMFACSEQGKIYSYATDYEGVFKQLDVYSSSVSFRQLVADSDNVICITDNGSLYLFDITKEEI